MPDIQLEAIKGRLETIHGLWENCSLLLQDLKQLSNHFSNGGMLEELLFFERMRLIVHHRLVLEISKIYSKSPMQDKSIHQLILKIEIYNKANPSKKIDVPIENIKTILNGTLKETIELNDRIRNKLVAHHDPENFNLEIEITFEKIEEMLNHVKEFIGKSYPVLFDKPLPDKVIINGAELVVDTVRKDLGIG